MTAVVGIDVGAEMTAGERPAPWQSPVAAAGLGKERSTNWLGAGSGNLATGLASEAPSFRSSWQAQMNAWRGVPSATNGVESQDASEAGTADTISAALTNRAASPGQTLPSAQMASSSLPSNGATTKPNLAIPDLSGQNEISSETDRPAWKVGQNAGAQIASTGNTEAAPAKRPGPANRSRAGTTTPSANPEKTAQAAIGGAQAVALTFEAPIIALPIQELPIQELPIQVPAAPVRSEIPTLAQTAGTISTPESSAAPSNWRTTQVSGSGPLPGPAQLSEAVKIASAATGTLVTSGSGSAAKAGARTLTVHAGPAFIPRNATQSHAVPQAAASSLDGADEPAASQSMASLSFPGVRWEASRHELSMTQTAAGNESLSVQSAAPSAGNLHHSATFESAAASLAPLETISGPVQVSVDSAQESSKQFTDRAASRAANRDATGESVASATQVSMTHPAELNTAASLGLRIPGAAPISPAPAAPDQPLAAAASGPATTQDRFAALDAGDSPGTPVWTQGGSQHAEAGFRDPALGWVSVRADLNAGGIHATLVPSSAEAAQALNGHLAGLSTHLVEQQSPVASLTMASPSESGVENGMGQRMQQGAEGNAHGNAPEEAQGGSQESARASGPSVLDASAQAGIHNSFAHAGELRGTHISVMA
jgi:hypothetical protein